MKKTVKKSGKKTAMVNMFKKDMKKVTKSPPLDESVKKFLVVKGPVGDGKTLMEFDTSERLAFGLGAMARNFIEGYDDNALEYLIYVFRVGLCGSEKVNEQILQQKKDEAKAKRGKKGVMKRRRRRKNYPPLPSLGSHVALGLASARGLEWRNGQ